jgi:organic hydroperoxide reductase OsmC/OhrA
MEDKYLYDTSVIWDEGRVGTLSSPTLDSFKVATPPEFPKGVPNTWSPEHLCVASVNVCLMTTFVAVAENSKLEIESYSCEGTGKLEKVDGKYMFSEIELKPVIKIKFEKDKERAERIIHKSEKICLISNSVKTKIILNPQIITQNNN